MQILDPLAFTRHPGPGDFAAYAEREKPFLNRRNMLWVTRRRVTARLTIADADFALAYRFQLVREWILAERSQSVIFVWTLRHLLWKLCLSGQLNAHEHNFMALTENLIFTRDRSIKDLAVDFAKQHGEIVGFHYDGVTIDQLCAGRARPVIGYGDVYLSNHRLVFSDALRLFSLPNRDIARVEAVSDALLVTTRSDLSFRIVCEAPPVLLAAFEKISG